METLIVLALLVALVYYLKKLPALASKRERNVKTPKTMPPKHFYSEALKKQIRPIETVRGLFKDIISILNQLGENIEITCWSEATSITNARTKYELDGENIGVSFFIGDEHVIGCDDQEKVAVNFQPGFGPIGGLRSSILHQLYKPSRELFLLGHWNNDQLWVISFDAQKIAEEIHNALESLRKALPLIEKMEKKKIDEIRGYHEKIRETKELINDAVKDIAKEVADAV